MFLYTCNQEHCNKSEIKINPPLLRASIVLISNWRDGDESRDKTGATAEASRLLSKDALI